MGSSTLVEDTTFSVTAALLEGLGRGTELIILDRVELDFRERGSLPKAVTQLSNKFREDAGEFGFDAGSAPYIALLLPAIHTFLAAFVPRFIDTLGAEAGKATAAGVKGLLLKIIKQAPTDPESAKVVQDLETSIKDRARQLDLPASYYDEIVKTLRKSPEIILAG